MRAAVEAEAGLPVLGAIPRAEGELLPGRHLGLVTPQEHARAEQSVNAAADLIRRSVDLKRLRAIAEAAALNPVTPPAGEPSRFAAPADGRGLRIGCFRSSAFTFYYPENLEAIKRTGAALVNIDPLEDKKLPAVDALYIGGGFPETHAAQLADNGSFRVSVAESAQRGMPIWAECGGLMFLARSIQWKDSNYPMASFLPVDISLGDKPAGHGYEEVVVDRPNSFIKPGTLLRGHEFHYSQIIAAEHVETAFWVRRGVGLGNGRDGMVMNRVLASYMHVHSLASPEWGNWLVEAGRRYNREKIASGFEESPLE